MCIPLNRHLAVAFQLYTRRRAYFHSLRGIIDPMPADCSYLLTILPKKNRITLSGIEPENIEIRFAASFYCQYICHYIFIMDKKFIFWKIFFYFFLQKSCSIFFDDPTIKDVDFLA